MSEETKTNANGATEPAEKSPANTTPPPAAPDNSVKVDIEKIEQMVSERAAKSAEKIMREALSTQGLDDEAIKEIVEDWKSKKKTPEQEAEEAKREAEVLKAQKAALETKIAVLGKGIPEDETDDYLAMAEVRISKGEAKTLEEALEIVLKKNPVQHKNGGASFGGKQPPNTTSFESAWGDQGGKQA